MVTIFLPLIYGKRLLIVPNSPTFSCDPLPLVVSNQARPAQMVGQVSKETRRLLYFRVSFHTEPESTLLDLELCERKPR